MSKISKRVECYFTELGTYRKDFMRYLKDFVKRQPNKGFDLIDNNIYVSVFYDGGNHTENSGSLLAQSLYIDEYDNLIIGLDNNCSAFPDCMYVSELAILCDEIDEWENN